MLKQLLNLTDNSVLQSVPYKLHTSLMCYSRSTFKSSLDYPSIHKCCLFILHVYFGLLSDSGPSFCLMSGYLQTPAPPRSFVKILSKHLSKHV